MDVSPKQVISIAAGMIPFLEHDDANRALMGANMQRQGVPLLQAESPLVGTGIEEQRRPRLEDLSSSPMRPAIVASVDCETYRRHQRRRTPAQPEARSQEPREGIYVYELRKFMRSNAGTCFNQKPIVAHGQKIKAGQIIADGPSTDKGEMALGRNVLVALHAVERLQLRRRHPDIRKGAEGRHLLPRSTFEEFEVDARDTKLGPEEITRDIPNVGEEAPRSTSTTTASSASVPK